ncbi:Putative fungal transcription factor [Septoria linicola]|uniref:Fungal transcription factor n=1 Tax=Septoria linicola TaxID=215465 RepID=A0A9Q9EQI1_9PEZI|nr:Putative fungal transcription factor [Septoria linicola]
MVSHRTAELSRGQSAASGPASPASSRSDSMFFLFSTTSSFRHMAAEPNNDTGSKAASVPDGIDFRFLNFSHPQEAKNAQTRRNVRSHVTTKQHEKHRQRVAEQARQTQQDSRQPSPTSSVHISRTSSGNSPAQSLSEPETSSPEASSSPSSPTGTTGPTRINPLQIYPEAWHSSLRPVMDHYCNYMAVDLPGTDATTRQAIRTHFMGLVLTDPATLHALMLLASAHYAKLRGEGSHNIDMLQLRGMAIQEVNRAMMDHGPQGRATSDRMIFAVGKMATFELLFGQRETFHTHMTGLQRMVSLRGGLQALGLGGMLERMLLWIDANAAEITGGALYFPAAAFTSSRGHPQADRRLFLMGLQVTAQ